MKENEMIFGIRAIVEALEANKEIDKIILQKDLDSAQSQMLFASLRSHPMVQVQRVPAERLKHYTLKDHQGAIAFISKVEYQKISNIVPSLFEEGKDPFVVLLDGVTDAAAEVQTGKSYQLDDLMDGKIFGVKNGTLTKFADGDGSGGYGFGAGTKPYKDFTVPDFTADPGYQFTLGEGLKAISARKAAQGGLLTGGTDKARANYATGLASQTYNDFFNRAATGYQLNQGNYFTGLNSAFDKWYKTTQLGANAAAQ